MGTVFQGFTNKHPPTLLWRVTFTPGNYRSIDRQKYLTTITCSTLEGMFNSWKVKTYAVCINQIENLHSI